MNKRVSAYAALIFLAYTLGSISRQQYYGLKDGTRLDRVANRSCQTHGPDSCLTRVPTTPFLKEEWGGHPMVSWPSDSAPQETKILVHQPGFTIFENIYMANTTYFIVSDEPASFPPLREIINRGLDIQEIDVDHDPTDKDIRIISTQEARQLFGLRAHHIQGVSMSTNESPQFIPHYYHFVGEILLGLWRLYSTLDSDIKPNGETSLEPVRRWIFPHVTNAEWMDYPGMNAFTIAAATPSASVWVSDQWAALADSPYPSVFDKLVVTERICAERTSDSWKEGKFAALAFRVPGSPHWWAPIRRNVLSYVGMSEEEIFQPPSKPVITYISRQETRRRLLNQDHERLVQALKQLERDHGYEVNILTLEHISRAEQVRVAARTTILMGVHGNGLTHLLWMQQNPKASVFEFYYPGAYIADYSWPATAMGFTHYGFWDNKYFTRPDVPEWNQPDGTHGSSIPIDASAVVQLCIDILSKQ